MNNTFDTPFRDPELRAQAESLDMVPGYYLTFGDRVFEQGSWSNGWSVVWRNHVTYQPYATAIQVGTEFYFMPMFPEFEPGFKSFAEMREIVKEVEVLAGKLEAARD